MNAFRPGQRVALLAFEDNPAETGYIVCGPTNGTWVVEVDVQFRESPTVGMVDDGIREVPEDQIQELQ